MAARPTIIFLPGLLCDATVFAAEVTALAPFADCVVADNARQATLVEMADDALALTDGPIAVIGHSMGARVAFEMIDKAPERITHACFADTGAHPPRPNEGASRQALIDLAFAEGMAALAERWLPPMVDSRRHGDMALMAPLQAMVRRASPEQYWRQAGALLGRRDARPLLPTITCPVLLLVGRQDQWSPIIQHEEMAALLPDPRLVVIEDAGHFAPVERPEAFSAALLDFLGFAGATIAQHAAVA